MANPNIRRGHAGGVSYPQSPEANYDERKSLASRQQADNDRAMALAQYKSDRLKAIASGVPESALHPPHEGMDLLAANQHLSFLTGGRGSANASARQTPNANQGPLDTATRATPTAPQAPVSPEEQAARDRLNTPASLTLAPQPPPASAPTSSTAPPPQRNAEAAGPPTPEQSAGNTRRTATGGTETLVPSQSGPRWVASTTNAPAPNNMHGEAYQAGGKVTQVQMRTPDTSKIQLTGNKAQDDATLASRRASDADFYRNPTQPLDQATRQIQQAPDSADAAAIAANAGHEGAGRTHFGPVSVVSANGGQRNTVAGIAPASAHNDINTGGNAPSVQPPAPQVASAPVAPPVPTPATAQPPAPAPTGAPAPSDAYAAGKAAREAVAAAPGKALSAVNSGIDTAGKAIVGAVAPPVINTMDRVKGFLGMDATPPARPPQPGPGKYSAPVGSSNAPIAAQPAPSARTVPPSAVVPPTQPAQITQQAPIGGVPPTERDNRKQFLDNRTGKANLPDDSAAAQMSQLTMQTAAPRQSTAPVSPDEDEELRRKRLSGMGSPIGPLSAM